MNRRAKKRKKKKWTLVTVALALVGWYLMAPPMSELPKYGLSVRSGEPMVNWSPVGLYDTASECKDARTTLHWEVQGRISRTVKTPFADDAPIGQQQADTECIATDDRRLKPN